jgi:hypothetical protein
MASTEPMLNRGSPRPVRLAASRQERIASPNRPCCASSIPVFDPPSGANIALAQPVVCGTYARTKASTALARSHSAPHFGTSVPTRNQKFENGASRPGAIRSEYTSFIIEAPSVPETCWVSTS